MSSIHPATEKRPWGEFRVFAANVPVTVKTILVKDGQSISLQYHHKRREFWHILSGMPEVTVGDTVVRAKKGDEFFIAPETNHRIRAVGGDAEFLEVSEGHFDEADIVRIEDMYGRS